MRTSTQIKHANKKEPGKINVFQNPKKKHHISINSLSCMVKIVCFPKLKHITMSPEECLPLSPFPFYAVNKLIALIGWNEKNLPDFKVTQRFLPPKHLQLTSKNICDLIVTCLETIVKSQQLVFVYFNSWYFLQGRITDGLGKEISVWKILLNNKSNYLLV